MKCFPGKPEIYLLTILKGGGKKKNYGTYEMHCLVLTK